MKNLLFIFSLSVLILFSCSSNDGDDDNSDKEVSLLGKWNLVSDLYQYKDHYTETITGCQLEYWQFDFKNSKEMTFRFTSDDPDLNIEQCDPEQFDYTYTIGTDYFNYEEKEKESLYLIPVDSENPELKLFIDSVTETHLILHGGMTENDYYRKFIFKKQN